MKGISDMGFIIRRSHTLVLISSLFLYGLAFADDPFLDMKVNKPRVRFEAPAFTLAGLNGKSGSLADYRGKVVILNFWATWCAPCRKEMPAMEKLWDEYKDRGVAMVAVSGDRGSADIVRKFVEDGHYSFHVLLDPDGETRRKYSIKVLPTTYIIGKDGRITGRIIGASDWEISRSRKLMEALLK